MASHWKSGADIIHPVSPKGQAECAQVIKIPLSHYLSISPSGGRSAVQWKWNDVSELVNSRSIMTVLLGFHFRIIYIPADQ